MWNKVFPTYIKSAFSKGDTLCQHISRKYIWNKVFTYESAPLISERHCLEIQCYQLTDTSDQCILNSWKKKIRAKGWWLSCSPGGVAGEWTWIQGTFGRRFLGIFCHMHMYMNELMFLRAESPAILISPPWKIFWSRKESSRESKSAGMPPNMGPWLSSSLRAPEEFGCHKPPHPSLLLWTGGFDELMCSVLFFPLTPKKRWFL